MKRIILTLSLVLCGCATTNTTPINLPKVQPDSSIMADCQAYQKMSVGTLEELTTLYISNSKILQECSQLNQAKKDFINRDMK